MALMCPPHSFDYFGINPSKTKTSIEDNHAASAFINHGKKLNVEAVVQLFGLLSVPLSVPVKAGRFGPTTHANSLVWSNFLLGAKRCKMASKLEDGRLSGFRYSVWPSLGLPSTRQARWEARESLNGPLPGGLLFQEPIHF